MEEEESPILIGREEPTVVIGREEEPSGRVTITVKVGGGEVKRSKAHLFNFYRLRMNSYEGGPTDAAVAVAVEAGFAGTDALDDVTAHVDRYLDEWMEQPYSQSNEVAKPKKSNDVHTKAKPTRK